eukprot:NODE_1544_length_832_cov_101.260536_g1286_i0.p3 GENE.NODE_1544_length_832_cov_101.260536_g1286_i0~~NODE_1544_length_832_cov_101.260536_g1286_i0.p3  ORF type:complete len:151 (+),score=24.91 NODE_1544_length_832_cov_101.260536_g1286_i0:30-482(+)
MGVVFRPCRFTLAGAADDDVLGAAVVAAFDRRPVRVVDFSLHPPGGFDPWVPLGDVALPRGEARWLALFIRTDGAGPSGMRLFDPAAGQETVLPDCDPSLRLLRLEGGSPPRWVSSCYALWCEVDESTAWWILRKSGHCTISLDLFCARH